MKPFLQFPGLVCWWFNPSCNTISLSPFCHTRQHHQRSHFHWVQWFIDCFEPVLWQYKFGRCQKHDLQSKDSWLQKSGLLTGSTKHIFGNFQKLDCFESGNKYIFVKYFKLDWFKPWGEAAIYIWRSASFHPEYLTILGICQKKSPRKFSNILPIL